MPPPRRPRAARRAHAATRTAPASRTACPRCGQPTVLLLGRPPGPFNDVFRCVSRVGGCGYLWSPRTPEPDGASEPPNCNPIS